MHILLYISLCQAVLNLIFCIQTLSINNDHVTRYQVLSNKEHASGKQTSVYDANVSAANVQPRRKGAAKKQSKSPRRTYLGQKVYFKFIFVNPITYEKICLWVTCVLTLTYILVRERENRHVRNMDIR